MSLTANDGDVRVEKEAKIGPHSVLFYRDFHIVVMCAACDKCRVIPSHDEDKQTAIKWAYGWLMGEPCEIREGPVDNSSSNGPKQAKLL